MLLFSLVFVCEWKFKIELFSITPLGFSKYYLCPWTFEIIILPHSPLYKSITHLQYYKHALDAVEIGLISQWHGKNIAWEDYVAHLTIKTLVFSSKCSRILGNRREEDNRETHPERWSKVQTAPQVVLGFLMDHENVHGGFSMTTMAITGYINQIEG